MKVGALMTIVAAIGMGAQAKDATEEQFSVVTVHVQYSFERVALALTRAKYVASAMFAEVGVRINWRAGRPSGPQEDLPILIDLTGNTPENLSPGALAYAQVYEGVHIRIFGDRIEEIGGRSWANQLLPHVMVHEITHILQGIYRHSPDGVMKAHWTIADLQKMAYKPLRFGPHDVTLIRAGLSRRSLAKQAIDSMNKDAAGIIGIASYPLVRPAQMSSY